MSTIIYLALIIFSALWVRKDAKKFRERGVNLNPGIWSTLVFLFWVIAFPWYLILKFSRYKKAAQLGNSALPSVSKIHSWWLVIIFVGIPLSIVLFLLASSLMRAKKISNETKVKTEQVGHVGATEEAARQKRTRDRVVVFEYNGNAQSFDLVGGGTDGGVAILVLGDYFKKNPPLIVMLTNETRVYKMVDGNKIEMDIAKLTNIKKGADVSIKYRVDKYKNNKSYVVTEITLNRGY